MMSLRCNRPKVIIVLLSLFLSVSSVNANSVLDINDPKVLESFVDQLVSPMMDESNSPSGVVAIAKGGQLLFNKGYGFQDIDNQIPVDPEATLFRPGSVSKLFTWVAVMQMVEQGKLDLDVDVNQYLKTFQVKDTYPGQSITMRHLMTHTAGFEHGVLGYVIIEDPSKSLPLANAMAKYQPERILPPNTQTAYSNYGTALAGLIVQNISGLDFALYIKTYIFDVLGMHDSTFQEPLPASMTKNMATAYEYDGSNYIARPFEILSNFAPAGAMTSTAPDMLQFAQAILQGGAYDGRRILKEETVRQMLAEQFTHDARLPGMSLGFYTANYNDTEVFKHRGDTLAFHSVLAFDQKNDLAFFAVFNGDGGAAVRSGFLPAFYDAYAPIVLEEIVPPTDFTERAEKYEGIYLFWRMSFSTIEKVLKLPSGMQVKVSDNNTLMVSGVGEYVEIGKNLFQRRDGLHKIAFQENESGEITGFVFGGAPFLSTFKAPFYYTTIFNYSSIGLSLVIFGLAIIVRVFRRSRYKAFIGMEKTVSRVVWQVSALHLLTVLSGVGAVAAGSVSTSGIGIIFTIWLVLPILVFLSSIYLFFCMIKVWAGQFYAGVWGRVGYSVITAAAVFMSWFYYFWNILGFQYFV